MQGCQWIRTTLGSDLIPPGFRGHPTRGDSASRRVHGEAAASELHGGVQGEGSPTREVERQVGDGGGGRPRPRGFGVTELDAVPGVACVEERLLRVEEARTIEHAPEYARLVVLAVAAHQAGRGTYGGPRVLRELRERGLSGRSCRAGRSGSDAIRRAAQRTRRRCRTYSTADSPSLYRIECGSATSSTPGREKAGSTCPSSLTSLHDASSTSWSMPSRRSSVGIECRTSRKGHCRDNAVVESFFGTLKNELLCRRSWHLAPRRRLPSTSTSRSSTSGIEGTRRSATRARQRMRSFTLRW